MKKFSLWIVIIFIATPFFAFSQNKMLTAADASYMNPAVFPKFMRQLQWIGDTHQFAYSKDNKIIASQVNKPEESLLFNLKTFNTDLKTAGFKSMPRFPQFKFSKQGVAIFSNKGVFYRYNYITHQVTKINTIPKGAENVFFNKNNHKVAYTIKNNLFYAENGKSTQITHEKNPGIVNGQIVSRNEFGIDKGIFWSPNGNSLAFYRKDQSGVTDYPLVNINPRPAKLKNIKYPMTGMTSEIIKLGVYNFISGKTIYLDTDTGHFGGKNHYLISVTWGPEEKYIYLAILNRGQDHLWMNKYNAQTGKFVKTLFEETNPKYVDPSNPLYFNPFNPDQFVWISRRDGWNHMYLYNTDGKLLKQLGKGRWEITKFFGFYRKNKIYYQSTKESPIQKNIYSVDVRTNKISRLSSDHGTHDAVISKDGKYLIDNYSNIETARAYNLISYKGKIIRTLQKDVHPLKNYNLGEMSIFNIKSPIDGRKLYCRMIKPANFDSTKKYPVIVYVYGGPHVQLITDSWLGGAGLFLNYLAQSGYVIFTLDNHGSENRGREFEQVIFRHLGTNEIKDQMAGVKYLKTLPFVDTTKIGVDGWSYGGFMTTSLMVRKPGVFKVAVAGGPVIDWKYYEVMYGERYMDTPKENPEGYKEASTLTYVKNLQGHLMLIHGTMDPVVVWQNSLMFLQKAIGMNKLMDYFVYPGQEHGVRGKDRIQLTRKIKTYFDDWLK